MEHPAYGELRKVTAYASVLLAHNPTAMTLEGTNTWVVRDPDATECIVIDPGPADPAHLKRVAETGPVAQILLTHHHPDHTEGAQDFAELTGAPIRALDAAWCSGGEAFLDAEVIEAAGVRIRTMATPGHTADSVCFVVDDRDEPAVFTGDSVLGRGTTVVAHPDGDLGSYLASLRGLADLPPAIRGLPGHGPELDDVASTASAYLDHRERRLEQVRAVVRECGPAVTTRQVVEVVYAEVDRSVWPAAEWTVQAQLAYLRDRGEL